MISSKFKPGDRIKYSTLTGTVCDATSISNYKHADGTYATVLEFDDKRDQTQTHGPEFRVWAFWDGDTRADFVKEINAQLINSAPVNPKNHPNQAPMPDATNGKISFGASVYAESRRDTGTEFGPGVLINPNTPNLHFNAIKEDISIVGTSRGYCWVQLNKNNYATCHDQLKVTLLPKGTATGRYCSNAVIQSMPRGLGKTGHIIQDMYVTEIGLSKASIKIKKSCICEIDTIMHHGCKCGGV